MEDEWDELNAALDEADQRFNDETDLRPLADLVWEQGADELVSCTDICLRERLIAEVLGLWAIQARDRRLADPAEHP